MTSDWTYNQNNELQGYDNMSFEYDLNGNLISKVDVSDPSNASYYTYDIENRLITISNPESQISNYYYDPFGRRLWKEVEGTTTYFMYADEGLVAELDDIGAESKTYGYVPNSTWTTDPLFMEEDGNYYFYHNDHLGTPQKMTSVNGAEVWSAMYSTFGEADVDASSTVTNNLRFPGQYYDSETGLHYNYNRYYDPSKGRYITSDPVRFEGGINYFSYVENNPNRWIDPIGFFEGEATYEYIRGFPYPNWNGKTRGMNNVTFYIHCDCPNSGTYVVCEFYLHDDIIILPDSAERWLSDENDEQYHNTVKTVESRVQNTLGHEEDERHIVEDFYSYNKQKIMDEEKVCNKSHDKCQKRARRIENQVKKNARKAIDFSKRTFHHGANATGNMYGNPDRLNNQGWLWW